MTFRAQTTVNDGYFVPCMRQVFRQTNDRPDIVIHSAYIQSNPRRDKRAKFGYLVRIQLLTWEDRVGENGILNAYVLLANEKICSIQFPGSPVSFELFFDTLSAANAFFENTRFTVIYGAHDFFRLHVPNEISILSHVNPATGKFDRCFMCISQFHRLVFEAPLRLTEHKGDDGQCCVCLDSMRRSSRRRGSTCTLLCGHSLHIDCLPRPRYLWDYVLMGTDVWAREIKCPLCRLKMYWAETESPDTSLLRLAEDLDDYYGYDDPEPAPAPAPIPVQIDYGFDEYA